MRPLRVGASQGSFGQLYQDQEAISTKICGQGVLTKIMGKNFQYTRYNSHTMSGDVTPQSPPATLPHSTSDSPKRCFGSPRPRNDVDSTGWSPDTESNSSRSTRSSKDSEKSTKEDSSNASSTDGSVPKFILQFDPNQLEQNQVHEHQHNRSSLHDSGANGTSALMASEEGAVSADSSIISPPLKLPASAPQRSSQRLISYFRAPSWSNPLPSVTEEPGLESEDNESDHNLERWTPLGIPHQHSIQSAASNTSSIYDDNKAHMEILAALKDLVVKKQEAIKDQNFDLCK
jgi:hypothetical protein